MDREVFSESEKRFLVTQILKASSVSLERMYMLFYELNEEPHWENIYLPTGRTVRECKTAFETIRSTISPFSTPNSVGFNRAYFNKRKAGDGNVETSSSVALEPKRRLSGRRSQDMGGQQLILPKPSSLDSLMPVSDLKFGQQTILPKPSPVDSVPSVSEILSAHQPILPKSLSVSDSGPSFSEVAERKRGRPPKSEVERRQQSIVRGETINPAKIVTQIRTILPDERTSVFSSQTSPTLISTDNGSQASTPTQRIAASAKRSGPIRQPGEGRFSLNEFIKPPSKRKPSTKTTKVESVSAVAPSAGPESSTSKLSAEITSNTRPNLKPPTSNVHPSKEAKSI